MTMTARLMTRNIRSRRTFRPVGRFKLTRAMACAGRVVWCGTKAGTYKFTTLED